MPCGLQYNLMIEPTKQSRRKRHTRYKYNPKAISNMVDCLSIEEFYGKYPECYNRLRFQVFRSKGYHCHYCDLIGTFVIVWVDGEDHCRVHTDLFAFNDSNRLVMMTIDHIVPKSKGGGKTVKNLITACQVCNNAKGDTDYETFLQKIGRSKQITE